METISQIVIFQIGNNRYTSRLIVKMIQANLSGIFVKLGRFYEILPVYIGRKYSYEATFELCGLEIGNLATVTIIPNGPCSNHN